MVRKLLYLVFTLFLSFSLHAQQYRWSQGAASNEIRYYRNAADKWGNVFVAGYFSGNATFGSTTLTSTGGTDAFVAKYDTTGVLLWVVAAGSPLNDQGYGVTVDTAGNCYVVGQFSGTCNFGNGKTNFAVGQTDAFVAKYSGSGVCQWVNRMGSNTSEYAYGIDCSSNGTVMVTGTFTGFCAFQGQPSNNIFATNIGNNEIFLARYNTNGAIQWVRTMGGGGYDFGYDVHCDDSTNAYLVGWYQGTANFGGITISGAGLSYSGFIAKYDRNGNVQWAQNCPGGTTYGYSYAIAGDGYGNIYVSGYFYGTALFGTISITSPNSGYSSYVAKLNTNGVFQWAQPISTNNSYTYAYDVAADASGNCFVTGIVYNYLGTNNSICNALFPTYSNGTGWWGYHAYGLKLKSNGQCAWSVRGTSVNTSGNFWGYAYGYGIGVNDFGSIYISGYNTPTLRFYIGNDTLTSYGGINSNGSFLARFQDSEFILIGNTKPTFCPGDSFYLPYKAYGIYQGNNEFKAMISDSSGSFLNYQYVGSKVGQLSDSILVRIPHNLPNGRGYRLRVEASNPLVRSNKSLNDIVIERPVANAGPDLTICIGDSIQLGAAYAYQYFWKSSFFIKDSTLRNPWVKPSNTSAIVLRTTNLAGCINFDTLIVNVIARPIPDAGRDTSVCRGDSLELKATGGNKFRWYPSIGLSDTTISNPKACITSNLRYFVWVGNGACEEKDSVYLTLRDPLLVTTNITSATICQGQTIMLKAYGSGGLDNNYSFTWDQGLGFGDTKYVNPTTTTLYTIVLTDNCTKQPDTAQILVTVRPPLAITLRDDTLICKGQSVMLFAAGTGGDSLNYKVNWFDNSTGNFLGSGFNLWLHNIDKSTIIKGVLTDGCTLVGDSNYVFIQTRNSLDVVASDDTTICLGQSANMRCNAIGGYALGYTYTWSHGLGSGASKNVSPNVTTTYSVIISDGCTNIQDTDFVTITVRPALKALVKADSFVCRGQSMTLTANATGGDSLNYNFIWFNATTRTLIGAGSSLPIGIISADARYGVVVSDNCTSLPDTAYVNLHLLPLPKIIVRTDTIICSGQSVKLFANGTGGDSTKYSFWWNQGIGVGNNLWVSPTVTTTYRAILNDNCSNQTDTGYVTVFIRAPLKINFTTDTTICRGQSIPLFVDGSGGDSLAYTFIWDNGLGNGKSVIVSPTVTTRYKVILKDNCTSLSDSATITVNVRDPLALEIGPDVKVCNGTDLLIKPVISGGFANQYAFQWIDKVSGATISSNKDLNLANITSPKYLRLILSDGCTVLPAIDSINIEVYPPLVLGLSSNKSKVCFGEQINIAALATGGKNSNLLVTWNHNLGTGLKKTLSPNSSTWIVVTLSDGCSLPVTDSIFIEVEQLPEPAYSVNTASGCVPFEVVFIDNSTNNTNNNYTWYFGDGDSSNSANPTHTYKNPGKYTVTLKLTSATGCNNVKTTPDFITALATPAITIQANPAKVKLDKAEVQIKLDQKNTDTYDLLFGDNTSLTNQPSSNNLVKKTYTDTGWFVISLLASNSFGCNTISTDTIYVEDIYTCFIPNSFSPNGDARNDMFMPIGTFVEKFEMTIFDRWGGEVFRADNSQGWDGTKDGIALPDGAYQYLITVYAKDRKPSFYSGSILLLR